MVIAQQQGRVDQVFKVQRDDGSRCIVYNAAVLENPSGHVANKWYARPYPVDVPQGLEAGEPYDTPEAAERAARTGVADRAF